MKNVKDFKNVNQTKAYIRETLFADLLDFFSKKYGADRVSVVGNNEISVAIDDITLADGTIAELCGNIKPVAKDYDKRVTSTKTIEGYERLLEADAYEIEKTEKERKAEEKIRLAQEKKQRDKEAREKKKEGK